MRGYIIITLLPLFLHACVTIDNDVRAVKTESDDFPASQMQKVEVKTRNGSIESDVRDDDSIHVVYDKWATGSDDQDAADNLKDIEVRVKEDNDSGILSIDVDMPNRSGTTYGCDVTLSLPASLFLELDSSNGAITVRDSQNGLECSTSNGAITIENTTGKAELETSNGKITVGNHQGALDGVTSNGEIEADVMLPEGGDCSLKSSNGKITLSLPDETSAMIEASTSNGKIEVDDLDITIISMNDKEFEGKMGDGAGNIKLETSNGAILITGR